MVETSQVTFITQSECFISAKRGSAIPKFVYVIDSCLLLWPCDGKQDLSLYFCDTFLMKEWNELSAKCQTRDWQRINWKMENSLWTIFPLEFSYRYRLALLSVGFNAGGQSSVDPSLPTIMQLRVWIPSTPSMLFNLYRLLILIKYYLLDWVNNENEEKRQGLAC